MRIPATPPAIESILEGVPPQLWLAAYQAAEAITDYPSWDKLRRRPAPEGVTHELWWAGVKLARRYIPLPLFDTSGTPFRYSMPGQVLEGLHDISVATAGTLGSLSDRLVNDASHRRYLMSSLRDEAISSSLLEGAATTRQVANEMLRSRRAPRTPGELMVANNFAAMEWIREHSNEALTPEGVCEVHRILTSGTVDDDEAGRLQQPHESRVVVSTSDGLVLHSPPPAEQLPQRLLQLCGFANGETGPEEWLHPLARAIITHFMVGYDHYFIDGNGRTARALFYWVALKEGHWLMEYLSLSRLLTAAPVQYGKAYLDTETDEGDVTYFIIHQLHVLRRALQHLDDYVQQKQRQLDATVVAARVLGLNHRQQAVVNGIAQDSGVVITASSHASSHGVTLQTARADLGALVDIGLLQTGKRGRQVTWTRAPQFDRRLEESL